MEWFWQNNVGRFLGFSVSKLGADNKPGYIVYTALWFAFPVFPLALAALYANREKWRTGEYLVPATVAVAGMLLLLLAASSRALYLLPLLPAFTLLSLPAFHHLSPEQLRQWNRGVRVITGIIATGGNNTLVADFTCRWPTIFFRPLWKMAAFALRAARKTTWCIPAGILLCVFLAFFIASRCPLPCSYGLYLVCRDSIALGASQYAADAMAQCDKKF